MTDQTTPEPLTDDELEEIRARLAASSPSPWEATPNGRILGQPRPEHAYERDVAEALFTADAELIAHAPDDLAHLLTLVDQLQGQLDECNNLIRDLHDDGPCQLDHHGYCHEHNWFETDPPCPDARAQALVQALGVPGDR